MKFHLYIDSADYQEICKCIPHPVVYGVTTNPTLMSRAGLTRDNLPQFVQSVFDLGAEKIQVQVQSSDPGEMIKDALNFNKMVGFPLVVKIPATRSGFIAGKELISMGFEVTFTAVYTPEQAHFAAVLGATYAAPYLGRLEDSEIDGISRIKKMQELVKGSKTSLLVASVRSRSAYLALLDLGVEAITIPPSLFGKLIDHEDTIEAEKKFLEDAR